MTFSSQGTVESKGTSADGTAYGPYTSSWSIPPYYAVKTGNSQPVSVQAGASTEVTNKGTVTYTFTWNGGWLHAPPPAKMWVHETSHAEWAAGGLYGSKTGSEDDGLGGSPITLGNSDGSSAGQESSGSKWEQKDSSGGTFTVTISPSASISLSEPQSIPGVPGASPFEAGIADVSTYAALNDHTIITSPMDTSYGIGDNDAPTSHVRQPDGSMDVDSVVGWGEPPNSYFGGGQQAWRVSGAPFTATSPFGSGSQYLWTASGDGSLDPPSNTSTVGFSLSDPNPDAFPKQSTFTVTVTEPSSGQTDTNTYKVTWHTPVEKRKKLYTTFSKKPLGEALLTGIYPNHSGSTIASEGAELSVNGLIDGVLAVVTRGASEEVGGLLELIGKWSGVVEYKVPIGPEGQTTGVTNWNGAHNDGPWNEAQTAQKDKYGGGNINPPGLTSDPNGWRLCQLSVYRMEHDQCDSYYAYGFNGNGYDGNALHLVQVNIVRPGCVWDEMYFTVFRNRSGDPVVPAPIGIGIGPGAVDSD